MYKQNRGKVSQIEIDEILESLNAQVRNGNRRISPARLRRERQATHRSGDQVDKAYEQMSKQELLTCVKKEKENNKQYRIELEERNREIRKIKERLEKLERLVQQTSENCITKETIESAVDENYKKLMEESQKRENEMIERIEEIKEKEAKKEKTLKTETNRYQDEILELKWSNERRERKERRTNVMIRGLGTSVKRNKEDLQNWMKETLEINIGIRNSWITKGKEEDDELIGVELASWEDKKKVMEKKSILKKKGLKVYIDNDLTWQERQVRRKLNEIKAEKKRLNKDANIKIGYYWIEVDNIRFVYDEKGKEPGLIRVEGRNK